MAVGQVLGVTFLIQLIYDLILIFPTVICQIILFGAL